MMQARTTLILIAVLCAALAESAGAQVSYHWIHPALRPLEEKLEPTRKVTYKTIGGETLQLHIFEPEGHVASDRRPAFVVFHGGGWTVGTTRAFYPFADYFAKKGMVGISVDYRLVETKRGMIADPANGTTVFDCVRDGRSAVRYVRAHAEELGIDPDRIAVGGGSAGGHLAAGTALFDGVDEEGEDTSVSSTPNALVLYYPVVDTSPKGYGAMLLSQRWKELSPVDNVKPNMPPTIIFHGTGDTLTPYPGAKRFHENMLAAGNSCELVTQPGGKHGYLIYDLDLFYREMKHTEVFLQANGLLPAAESPKTQ